MLLFWKVSRGVACAASSLTLNVVGSSPCSSASLLLTGTFEQNLLQPSWTSAYHGAPIPPRWRETSTTGEPKPFIHSKGLQAGLTQTSAASSVLFWNLILFQSAVTKLRQSSYNYKSESIKKRKNLFKTKTQKYKTGGSCEGAMLVGLL